ncbi:hypothetical protein [Desulfopila inferna]|uniref:hypothetical protein n=1 Tax=Desulfopila inferna TaxID=468528 RepID=UPI0019664E40|nr:hypothetical protein [Desulfopila inferna]MBM9606339.1 hypothetical protein [Desulfopila inferna]
MQPFKANCLPLLIGSLPIDNHSQAMELILTHTPEIPLWPQLPAYKEEGMVPQFLPGMPGIDECDDTVFINGKGEKFDAEFLSFYEEYLMITEGGGSLEGSRFALTTETAKGFFDFLEHTAGVKEGLAALKAQTTGPFTFATGVVDQDNRAIFYNDQLRDAAIKLLALKAKWQIVKMKEICPRTIMIFDEPALAGFGSSAFITISADDVKECFAEVFEAVQSEGALAGVHVCANTEWSILFDAGADLVSFDAYSYFDKLILYPAQLRAFFNKGGILASGIIPTTPEFIDEVDGASLTGKWLEQARELENIGIPMEQILQQTLITPSCGTGSINFDYAGRVMALTREVSTTIREKFSLS